MLRALCDLCFCASAVLLGWEGLRLCARLGTFDMLFYSVRFVRGKAREGFYQYCKEKQNKQGRGNKYIILSGCVLGGVSAVLLLLQRGIGG